MKEKIKGCLLRLGCHFYSSWYYLKHSSICTTGQVLRIGNIYTYKESGHVDIVRVLNVCKVNGYLYCTLYFFEENKIITVDQRLNPDDYIIWQILENREYDEIMSMQLWQEVDKQKYLMDF